MIESNITAQQRRDTDLNWSCVLGCAYVLQIQNQSQNILFMCGEKKTFSVLKASFIFGFTTSWCHFLPVIRDVSQLKPCSIIQAKSQLCFQHYILQLLAFRCL